MRRSFFRMLFHASLMFILAALCGAQVPEKQPQPPPLPPAASDVPTAQPCPQISILKPQQNAFRDGTPVKFRANLSSGDSKTTLFFSWSISAGTVIAGQGTPTLEVDTTGAGAEKTLTATVLVGGLPAECMSMDASATINVAGPAQKVDEYGTIPEAEENAKLDAFVANVTPAEQAYIIAYAGKSTLRGQAGTDLRRIRAYLLKGGIPAERLVTIDGGYREEQTRELWIVPIGAEPPRSSPTVNVKDVVFIKPPPPPAKKP
ncbi:MAG: hypothetical protein JO053_15770 [Acidobacteria bacterium]|nr:hypothetical protein [Acidobacteriota bacterium]